MGKRGPAPLPDNVHRLAGNPSKKDLSRSQDGQVPTEVPPVPEHIEADEVAAAEWKFITGELFRLGLIAKVDKMSIAVYCTACSRMIRAERKIQELEAQGEEPMLQSTPNGYQQIGPWLQVYNRSVEQMKSAAAEFGMTPSARVRVEPRPQLDMFGGNDNSDGEEQSDRGGEEDPEAKYFS